MFGSRLSPEFVIGNSRKRAAAVFEQLRFRARSFAAWSSLGQSRVLVVVNEFLHREPAFADPIKARPIILSGPGA
jgi:hypothetical protein